MKLNIESIFTPKYDNYFDIARYKLTWQIGVFALLSLTALNVVFFITDSSESTTPNFIAIVIVFAALYIMYKSKKYEIAAYLFSIAGTIITNFSIYNYPETPHFIDAVWITILLIYAFFALGKKVGIFILIADFISLSLYIMFFLNKSIAELETPTLNDKIALVFSTAICFSIFSYIIFLFLKTTKTAENDYLRLTEELKDSNKEKSVLLKEVHHRVKNNFQVIISLMRLTADNANNELSYSDTINRIQSMSLIHEKIYQTPDLANIDFEDYIKSLASELIESYSIDTQIELTITSNLRSLTLKSLVPVALIFNELISNTIKHGFKDQKTGIISIEIKDHYPTTEINYSDSGIWVESNHSDSIGLELVQALSEQLTGEFVRNISDGTHYKFLFTYDK